MTLTCRNKRCKHSEAGTCTAEAVTITAGGECGAEEWKGEGLV